MRVCAECAQDGRCPAATLAQYARVCWTALMQSLPYPECAEFREKYWKGKAA